jgi:hypothetical protein
MYAAADGYVTRQPLDASDPEHLRHAFGLAGPDCAAIITNTPHNTNEACSIVETLIALVEGRRIDFATALFRSIWGAEPVSPSQPAVILTVKFFAVGVLGGSRGAKEAQ